MIFNLPVIGVLSRLAWWQFMQGGFNGACCVSHAEMCHVC